MKNYDNMIEVLTYFADKCGMFKPILGGVSELKVENEMLRNELAREVVYKDRVALDNIYSTDSITFRVDVSANSEKETQEFDNDLFTLIKRVVEVGQDNYDYNKILDMLDFYVAIGKLDWDAWDFVFELMESQIPA